jgi:hypothetical protein
MFGGRGRPGVKRLLTLYLVFAPTMIARYGDFLSSERLTDMMSTGRAGTGPEAAFARLASGRNGRRAGRVGDVLPGFGRAWMRTGRRLRAGDEDSAMRKRYI